MVQALEVKGWLDGKRLKKWRKQMEDIKWLSPKEEQEAISKAYSQEVSKVIQFMDLLPDPLEDMEHQVHELRRKLRWLSIYVHALNHATRLEPSPEEKNIAYKKYFTKAVKDSPFNKIEVDLNIKYPLVLNREAFWGLSWLIAELGEAKDKVLHLEAKLQLAQANKLSNGAQKQVSMLQENYEQLKSSTLKACNKTIKSFHQYQVLQGLVY